MEKKESNKTIAILLMMVAVFCEVITFAGCLNYATTAEEPFYWIPAFVSAITFAICFYKVAKETLDEINEK